MNRLILIGNGFDLAHGMKTSYNDFMLWYLKDVLNQTVDKGIYDDALIHVSTSYQVSFPLGILKDIPDLVNYFYRKNLSFLFTHNVFKFQGFEYNDYRNPFKFEIKSVLLKKLLFECSNLNWIDIERVYYEHLEDAFKESLHTKKVLYAQALNRDFAFLILKLKEYLLTLKAPDNQNLYKDLLSSPFDENDFVNWKIDTFDPEETLILNFNYTSTVEQYLDSALKYISDYKILCRINYIHGKLSDPYNPLIFGFGDEIGELYKKIELLNENEFFKYFKTFGYSHTTNYHDLVRFINMRPFQVFILGHSCGLSDRTMLNMIFEAENCKSIKVFYHKSTDERNNFANLIYEISRHFSNKNSMRIKVNTFKIEEFMPQIQGHDI